MNPSSQSLQSPYPKIIVLDDDPTGSQTVHSCLLLMQWDVDTLRLGLRDASPIFFILTNTRSLPPEQAEQITREVCRNLKVAIAQEKIQQFLIVSRSDSTLRGHYPLETDAIAAEMGPFDAHFLVPAFFEGGRLTYNSTHYIRTQDIQGKTIDVPVHETEFARDPMFAFHHSYLPDYVAQKTQGAIAAPAVTRLQQPDIQSGCLDQLLTLQQNQCVVVDGETQADLDRFALDLLSATAQGKRFLFRSAASLLTSLAQLPLQPVAAEAMGQYTRQQQPGIILVGSYVAKTTAQLHVLLQHPHIKAIEIDVSQFIDYPPQSRHSAPPPVPFGQASQIQGGVRGGTTQASLETLLTETLHQIQIAHQAGQDVVIYTSREEITFEQVSQRIAFSHRVAQFLVEIVRGLPDTIGFLISKGGITSNNTLSQGLQLRSIRLLGQILPGCCLVKTEATHPQFPNLPVVLFPGNVGEVDGLAIANQRLKTTTPVLPLTKGS